MSGSRLQVIIDGVPMSDVDARAFWGRFSAHMDASRGDLAGFAAKEGFASVHPEMRAEGATLLVSKSAPQRPYANAPNRDAGGGARGGGSRGNRSGQRANHSDPNESRKPHKKRG